MTDYNIADTLSKVAAKIPDKIGLIEAASGLQLNFEQLETRADRYGSFLRESGVGQGDRVMLMVKPSADFICLTFALFKIGAPVILIDPGMGYKNLLRCIASVKPRFIIGIPIVILLSYLFRKPFETVKKRFLCGKLFGFSAYDIRRQIDNKLPSINVFQPKKDDLAAIIFTTGSTGPPKGVRFEHSIFTAQLNHIRNYYKIGSNDVDQPGFPLFGLFSIALGACAVIPDMDPTKPAKVNPEKFVNSIKKFGVTYSFGSPAIWNVVSRYCVDKGIRCEHLKKVLMAGAPVPGNLVETVFRIMSDDGQIFTPYGATESLPIVSIEGREINNETWDKTRQGKGTCVGRPLPGISLSIIKCNDNSFESIEDCEFLNPYEIGEIIVKGDVVTRSYDNNPDETRKSKILDKDSFWHRVGDVGYLDEKDRLWFCGRKAHRVISDKGIMYTIPCEAIINNHTDVFRSALVGVKNSNGFQTPVILIEKYPQSKKADMELLDEVRMIARDHELTREIDYFFVHPSFPVDIRHNAKIFREKLSIWAG